MTKTNLISSDYQLLVDEISEYFSKSNIILQNDRNIIKEIEFNGQKLVVKSYAVPIFIQRFIYTYWKKSKARRAYEYALKIAKFTPQAVAFVEYYQQNLLHKSYFICEKFEADFDIRKPLFNPDFADRDLIFKAFAKFVFELHQRQIMHQDLSAGNILIKAKNGNYEFKIIDINRMTFKKLSPQQRARNFNKLWANDEDLAIILAEYAKLAELDFNYFVKIGLKYNQKLKRGKTRKKKIKQILGLC